MRPTVPAFAAATQEDLPGIARLLPDGVEAFWQSRKVSVSPEGEP